MRHVLYSTDGQGNWRKREWEPQCREKVFIAGRCQGVQGHKGPHWSYGPDGSLCRDDNEADPVMNGSAESIPPGHTNYISPVDMQDQLCRKHYTDSDVTDPAEIERLERGEMQEGESITRPCTPEEEERLRLRKE